VLLAMLVAAVPAARPTFAQPAAPINVTRADDADTYVQGTCGANGCTLREAILLANDTAGPNSITFQIPLPQSAAFVTIAPNTPLPALIDDGTTIDGTNLATGAVHQIVLSGEIMASNNQPGHGLVIFGSDNEVRNLVIGGFPRGDTDIASGSAIFIDGSLDADNGDRNRFYNNLIGVAADGNSAFDNGRYGVRLIGGASNNIIGGTGPNQRNVISRGGVANIGVGGTGETARNRDNVIAGNYIGTNAAGNARPAGTTANSAQAGINVDSGATNTLITDNVIGGMLGGSITNNVIAGVFIAGLDTSPDNPLTPSGTVLQRNYIGVNRDSVAISNRVGVLIGSPARYGPFNTTIGDPANPAGGRNFIAGNSFIGLEVAELSLFGDMTIAGNYIGVAPNNSMLGNGSLAVAETGGDGVRVGQYGAGLTPGRVTVGPGNVISANATFGMRFRSGGHTVRGNFIGTDVSGASSNLQVSGSGGTANGSASIWIENGNNITVGGASAADRNVIAFGGSVNTGAGEAILVNPDFAQQPSGNCGTQGNRVPCTTGSHTISNNHLGVRADGGAALNTNTSSQSLRAGVRLVRTSGNTIRANVIAGLGNGLVLGTSAGGATAANDNEIRDNRIGTRASGSTTAGTGIGTRQNGIWLLAGTNNTIADNLIAFSGQEFNSGSGIQVGGGSGGANTNVVSGNRLIRNGSFGAGDGIRVTGATSIRITRTTTTANAQLGISLQSGGNGGRAAPTISGVAAGTPPTISGTAAGCDGCTVEVFGSSTSEADEGPVFIASGTVSGGAFSFGIPGCLQFLTATVTDAAGNTSPFSAVFNAGAPCQTAPTLTLGAAPDNTLSAAPGSSATYTHRLTHNVQAERTYTLVITSTRGWAAAPAFVTLPAAPAGGTSSADFNVVVTVPIGTSTDTTPPLTDETRVRAFVGSTTSAEQLNITTVQAVAQIPATPVVSPGQSRPFVASSSISFSHTVTNTGTLSGIFEVQNLEVVGAPAGFVASSTLGAPTLAGGESRPFTIVVTTPGAPPAPGNITVRFRVVVRNGNPSGLVSNTIVVPVVRGFTFTPDTVQTRTTPPGTPVSFDYVLTNTGNAADSFVVSGAPTGTGNPITFEGAAVVAPGASLTNLAAGASTTVRVTFRSPSNTTVNTYGVAVTARAADSATPPGNVTRNATITITGGGSAAITPGTANPPSVNVINGPATVTFVNTVTNTGNAPVTITVPASFAAPGGLTATVLAAGNTCNAQVATGATCQFTVEVSVPQGTLAGPYDITISATADNPAGTPDVTATAVNRVTVQLVSGVELSPGTAQEGAPGELLTFTHTLTNTGNGADRFDLTASGSLPGWNVLITPTLTPDLPAGGTINVTVTARVPAVARDADQNLITVTADSRGGDATATATNTADVEAVVAADLSPGRTRNLNPGDTVSFSHTITNTGTTVTSFELQAESAAAGWSLSVTGSPTGPLDPGETSTVSVAVTAPADAQPRDTATILLRVREAGTADPILDEEQDVAAVGPAVGVLITPDNAGVALPGETTVFTHTITNIGTNPGLFRLSVAEANNWPVRVLPSEVPLGPGQEREIEVRVTVPDGTRATASGAPPAGLIRVVAELVGDPTVTDDATTSITVGRVVGVALSSAQVRRVNAGGPAQSLSSLVVYNSGNAFDSFDLGLAPGQELPAGWSLSFTPATVQVDKDSTFRVGVTVRVPEGVEPRTVQRITVRATSRADTSKFDDVQVTLVYDPVVLRYVLLPLVAK
jgi:CSLREA domain-containing protein